MERMHVFCKIFLLGTIAGELQHLSNKILQRGGQIHGGINPHLRWLLTKRIEKTIVGDIITDDHVKTNPWCIAPFLEPSQHLGNWHHKASPLALAQPPRRHYNLLKQPGFTLALKNGFDFY